MRQVPCSRLSSNAALDSSDWRCSRTSEESVCRSHGSQRADPCTMTPDFWVPGSVKLHNGPQDREEENIDNATEENATEDAKKGEEMTDAGGARAEGRAGNSDVPTERTGPVKKDSSEETHNYRRVPGGVWLNKVRSLFKGQCKETQNSWDRGEEGRDVHQGIIASQEGNLGGTTRETLRERNTPAHQFDIVQNS
ncbi:hypothetical protein NDU88_002312 [Pleurodeles waltl]|uniref:Uncharacterized protein n=1 Tax=Pleurodeles waltl TaxID=8319 RepID=A0AAV7NLM7_PLEWA|nr:hypothetical protein NDU88_002312 [Pleurodeles waltl]